VGICKINILEN